MENEKANLLKKIAGNKKTFDSILAQKEEEIGIFNELQKEHIHQIEILKRQNKLNSV